MSSDTTLRPSSSGITDSDMNFFFLYFRIKRSNHTVSSDFAYNTHTIVKSRALPSQSNSLDAWIELIGSSTDLTEILDTIKRIESVLQSEDKVSVASNNRTRQNGRKVCLYAH